ncbi:hypothetical protein HK104_008767, partial [Borealophlyctis nickersoniae]
MADATTLQRSAAIGFLRRRGAERTAAETEPQKPAEQQQQQQPQPSLSAHDTGSKDLALRENVAAVGGGDRAEGGGAGFAGMPGKDNGRGSSSSSSRASSGSSTRNSAIKVDEPAAVHGKKRSFLGQPIQIPNANHSRPMPFRERMTHNESPDYPPSPALIDDLSPLSPLSPYPIPAIRYSNGFRPLFDREEQSMLDTKWEPILTTPPTIIHPAGMVSPPISGPPGYKGLVTLERISVLLRRKEEELILEREAEQMNVTTLERKAARSQEQRRKLLLGEDKEEMPPVPTLTLQIPPTSPIAESRPRAESHSSIEPQAAAAARAQAVNFLAQRRRAASLSRAEEGTGRDTLRRGGRADWQNPVSPVSPRSENFATADVRDSCSSEIEQLIIERPWATLDFRTPRHHPARNMRRNSASSILTNGDRDVPPTAAAATSDPIIIDEQQNRNPSPSYEPPPFRSQPLHYPQPASLSPSTIIIPQRQKSLHQGIPDPQSTFRRAKAEILASRPPTPQSPPQLPSRISPPVPPASPVTTAPSSSSSSSSTYIPSLASNIVRQQQQQPFIPVRSTSRRRLASNPGTLPSPTSSPVFLHSYATTPRPQQSGPSSMLRPGFATMGRQGADGGRDGVDMDDEYGDADTEEDDTSAARRGRSRAISDLLFRGGKDRAKSANGLRQDSESPPLRFQQQRDGAGGRRGGGPDGMVIDTKPAKKEGWVKGMMNGNSGGGKGALQQSGGQGGSARSGAFANWKNPLSTARPRAGTISGPTDGPRSPSSPLSDSRMAFTQLRPRAGTFAGATQANPYPSSAYPSSAYPSSAYPSSAYPSSAYPPASPYPPTSPYPTSSYPSLPYPSSSSLHVPASPPPLPGSPPLPTNGRLSWSNLPLKQTRDFLFQGRAWQVLTASTVKDRYLFLFTDVLVIAKQIPPSSNTLNPNSTPLYQVKNILPLRQAQLVVKDDRTYQPDQTNHPVWQATMRRFGTNPIKAVAYLIAKRGIPCTPEAIAHFLHVTPNLPRKQIGKFLGIPEHRDILTAYVGMFVFRGQSLDQSLRVFLSVVRIPSEGAG